MNTEIYNRVVSFLCLSVETDQRWRNETRRLTAESKILQLFQIHLYTRPYNPTPIAATLKILRKLSTVANVCATIEEAALWLHHADETVVCHFSEIMYQIAVWAGSDQPVATLSLLSKLADKHNLISSSDKSFKYSNLQLSSDCRISMVTEITELLRNTETVGQGMQLLLWLCKFEMQDSLYEDNVNVTPIIAVLLHWLQSSYPPPEMSTERFQFLKLLSIRCINAMMENTSSTVALARWWTEEQQSIRKSKERLDDIYLLLSSHLEHPNYMMEVLEQRVPLSSAMRCVTMDTAYKAVNNLLLAFQRIAYSGGLHEMQQSMQCCNWSNLYQAFMTRARETDQKLFHTVAMVHFEHTMKIIKELSADPPVTSLVSLKQLAAQQVNRDYTADVLKKLLPAEILVSKISLFSKFLQEYMENLHKMLEHQRRPIAWLLEDNLAKLSDLLQPCGRFNFSETFVSNVIWVGYS